MENNTNQSGGRSSGTQNRNRNRNRSRNGGGNNNRQGGNSNNRNRSRNRNRKPKVIELTLGQKIIKALTFGAIDPNKSKPKYSNPKPKQSQSQRSESEFKAGSNPKPKPGGATKPARTPNRAPKTYEVTSARLYVGNLDYDAAESDLEDLFRGVGNVLEAEVVTNSRTQQSKGFAFVEMGSIEEAKRAVEVLHDQDFMGRKLLVSGAKSEGPRNSDSDSDAAEA